MNTASPTRRPLALLGLLVASGLLAGCGAGAAADTGAEGSASASPSLQATAATLEPGDAVLAPTGKVLLTVRGGTTTNVGGALKLDRELLEAMGTVTYSVDDSQATGARAEFTGPLLQTVLDVAGASGDTLHTVALNDYVVDIPSSDARDLPVMVATQQDGEPMTVETYGPLRLIYPTEGYDLDDATYMPRWIWQLDKIVVR